MRWAPRATRLDVAELVEAGSGELPPPPSGDDLAAVLFTSGATGPAKGVRYLHRQLVAQRDALAATYSITSADRLVAAFAPFALYGPALGIPTALANCDVTKPADLTAAALDEACTRIGATLAFASPSALANVVATAARVTVGRPRGAARRVLRRRSGALGDTAGRCRACPERQLHTPYGMTEVLPVTTSNSVRSSPPKQPTRPGGCAWVDRWPVRRCASCRSASTPRSCRTRSPGGATGEILVRAPWVSEGYLGLWATSAQPGRARASGTARVTSVMSTSTDACGSRGGRCTSSTAPMARSRRYRSNERWSEDSGSAAVLPSEWGPSEASSWWS